MLNRIQRGASDLINLFLIPAWISILPGPLRFRALRFWARHDRSHEPAVDEAWNQASRYAGCVDETAWRWKFRLLRLQDRVDVWLVLTRSARWWRRRIEQDGAWPEAGPCLILTFHWGSAHWIWSLLRAQGMSAHFLARRPEVADIGLGRFALWFANLRVLGMRRAGGLGPLFTGGSSARIREAFQHGASLIGMLDLPAAEHAGSAVRPLLSGQARFPDRLAELAVAAGVRVAILSGGLDTRSGIRKLHVETLEPGVSVDRIMTRYAQHLDACLREEPAFWQLWGVAPLMFTDGSEPRP